jgi:UDP-2,4-diacetamido-2,4,6-trideoxy-beta-L-altropyranose hydrolase
MSVRHILILTEFGTKVGYGHLTRCFSVAEAFRSAKKSVEIWGAPGPGTAAPVSAADRIVEWYDAAGKLAAQIAAFDAIIVDSFIATLPQIEHLTRCNPRIAFIDDFVRRSYRQGCVIDWTVGAEKFAYPKKAPAVTYLLGSQYSALRPPFASQWERKHPDVPRSVLVTFGGSDIREMTAPVLALLNNAFPTLKKRVVLGAGFRTLDYKPLGTNPQIEFTVAPNGAQMQALMAEADLALCGGGQTLFELASQGLAPVVISMIDNQEDDVSGFTRIGFASSAGWWNDSRLFSNIATGLRVLWPREVRVERAQMGRRWVDGLGAGRLRDRLLLHWGEP